MEKRFFFFKTYCPMVDHQVDMDRCSICTQNKGIDTEGLFVECGWGEDNGLDN